REMGKAMMGTGEASGEKRALAAAEAAISNPLIDDSSMKGAKGLLISITGGRDLTLYEVDEAATRIREEVDQDANIIVGATFDENLEGIIRVAVVATGIDQAASGRPVSAPETRLAEIAHKLRSDQQRLTERVERTELPRAVAPPAQASAAMSHGVESAARAAVAAAVLPITSIEDVTIRPMQPKPSLFPEAAENEPAAPEPALPRAFIPPAPERPGNRPQRMPRIDELPLPAQNELRAQQGDGPEHPEKRRMSLLQRLATVGLGRREEATEEAPAPVSRPPRPVPRPAERAPQQRPVPRPAEVRGPDPVSDYARRPAHQALDQHGRQGPVHNSPEEDHLDIPAFLRRQAT
ncbi:MAG TPA: cell division protein FtsZ, partial [Xanthobacteraceae bacterium]